MALFEMKFQPGVDKQDTAVGATDRWIDSDNVRWRYNLPEKVGGWSSLLTDTIVGVARRQHAFVDTDGNKYVAIGTDKFLLIYFEGTLYDITPWRSNSAGVQTTFTSSTLATDSTTAKTCTITTGSDHSLEVGDIIVLDSVTLPALTGLSATDFEDCFTLQLNYGVNNLLYTKLKFVRCYFLDFSIFSIAHPQLTFVSRARLSLR